jgi:hypothetical protein
MISRSKTAILALTILVTGVLTANTVLATSTTMPAVTPERIALAKAYIASVPMEDEIRAAVESMANNIKPEQRVLFRSLADKSIDYNKLRAAAEATTAQMFTDGEIKAMTAFFSTPEGKSIRAKMPAYEQAMTPVMTEVLRDFVVKLQENNVLPVSVAPGQ